jgi:hypothetical protein
MTGESGGVSQGQCDRKKNGTNIDSEYRSFSPFFFAGIALFFFQGPID